MPVGLRAVSSPRLLGIDWGNLDNLAPNEYVVDWQAKDSSTPVYSPNRLRSGMLVAVPAWKLTKLVETAEVQRQIADLVVAQ